MKAVRVNIVIRDIDGIEHVPSVTSASQLSTIPLKFT
jgi:hypothetical protein